MLQQNTHCFIDRTIFLSDFHVKLQYIIFCLLFMAFFTTFNFLKVHEDFVYSCVIRFLRFVAESI